MGLLWSQPSSARQRLASLFTVASPFRYGLAAVIVVTVAYAVLGVFPMLRRDLQLLHDVHALDEQGIRLTGELRNQLQQDRISSYRVLLARGDPSELEQAFGDLREADAAVAKVESSLAQLRDSPADRQLQFHRNWLAYAAVRDRILATSLGRVLNAGSGKVTAASRKDRPVTLLSDPGLQRGKGPDAVSEQAAFDQAQLAAQTWEGAFQSASDSHIGEVARTLKSSFEDWQSLMVFKIVVLILLLWTDLKRSKAEIKLKLATEKLRASQDRLRMAYDSSAVGMGIISLDGEIISANAVAANILGYDASELIGRQVRDFIAPEFEPTLNQDLASLHNGEVTSYGAERQFLRKDGSLIWVRNNVTRMPVSEDNQHCFFTSEEITDQKLANDRLAYLANYDPITNLPNRHSFEEQLTEALQDSTCPSNCIAMLYVEIDSFDFLKGTFGRNVADEVLSELAIILNAFREPGEVVGRLDDHVFGVMMHAAPFDAATVDRATQLREIFHRFGESGKHRIPVSASIGVAYSELEKPRSPSRRSSESQRAAGSASDRDPRNLSRNQAATASEALLKYARAAMLEARSRGGDAIFVADPGLQERAVQRHQIESALLQGLRRDEFRVVFQPQFHIATGKLVRFEALCRWNSAELGTVPPDRFIPIAEQTGLIAEIGRRVMHDALREAKLWAGSGRQIGVAVNISPMQFMRPDFTQVVTEALASSGFPPGLLELEITEGIFIRDLNLAVARIRELQRLGLSIALDDFGTGYSSLSYLQRMPIDAVKLDRSFVSDLTTDAATVSMVRSVLSMAEALHLRVVTEGVETEAQLQILHSLGCDEAQGYLLGRPETAELALRRVLDSPLQPVATLVS
jgi:PAS domain S-box-containing protein/diguanylate cyclase (GGDEF)-like protein